MWRLASAAAVAVAQIPLARWNFEAIAHTAHAARYGGFISVTRFDAVRFALAPAEASVMDPQQRMVLELSYEALHAAALPRALLNGSETAVYVGVMSTEFREALLRANSYEVTGACMHLNVAPLVQLLTPLPR